ncbi:COG2958 family protein [Paraburkholderia hospita]|uniref:COG2958 family protein n=1 Tax=Paraburkholderia hospita TaxID=169430 RepID=UPI0009A8B457|nr:HrgA protein [Paraburkholderia hospita]
MKLELRKRVLERLRADPGAKLTAAEIARWIMSTYPAECAQKIADSTVIETDEQLFAQLRAEIYGSHRNWQHQDPFLKTTEGRPRRFFWSQKDDATEVAEAEAPVSRADEAAGRRTEHSLYPLLATYLWTEHNVHSMRIDEKRSGNRSGSGANEWLHPDIVGMQDLSSDWTSEIRACVREHADTRTKLWAFEVKLLLNRSNVRRSFFQTVSNASWANFGYLVAAEIEGSDTLKELRLLATAHGVGVIQLDADDPPASQILIPARERADIDWDTCNRLAEENRDFVEYIKLVRKFYQTGETSARDWGLKLNEE